MRFAGKTNHLKEAFCRFSSDKICFRFSSFNAMAQINENVQTLLAIAKEHFENAWKLPATHAAYSPGRVNLIGEHTDYNDGFVFPMVS